MKLAMLTQVLRDVLERIMWPGRRRPHRMTLTAPLDTGRIAFPHVELFYSTRTGDPIGVWCDCEIGADHTYAEWKARFQQPEHDLDQLNAAFTQ